MPGPLLLLAAALVLLPGCWSAPEASLQSKGTPRPIQGTVAVAVESVKPPAVVQSVDLDARAVTMLPRREARLIFYKVGSNVSNLGHLKLGDTVQATVAEELTVYVTRGGNLPSAGGLPPVVTDAQVLSVDPSYRLLTVHYPDGHDETFKVGLQVKLDQMEPGDEVTIRPVEAIALRTKK